MQQPANNVSGYELSADYLRGFRHSVEALDLLKDVPFPESFQATLERLDTASWWPPTDLEVWGEKVIAVRGDAAVEAIGFGLIVAPVRPSFRVSVKLNKKDPAAVLKHFASLCGESIRGLSVRLLSPAPNRAMLQVTYPQRDPPRANGLLWKGTLTRVCRSVPGLSLVEMREMPGAFQFMFAW